MRRHPALSAPSLRLLLSCLLPCLLPLLALVASNGCSNQGEGDVCSLQADNNGNDDCQDGLTCQAVAGPNAGARCCPVDRSTATTAVCAINTPGVDASTAPPDGSTASEAGDDASQTPDGADAASLSSDDASPDSGDASPDGDAAGD